MEILFFEELFMYHDKGPRFVIVWVIATIAALFFFVLSYREKKEKGWRILCFIGAILIFATPAMVFFVSGFTTYAKCMYEVQLNGDDVPDGYEIVSERGEITTLVQKFKKDEYTEGICELK